MAGLARSIAWALRRGALTPAHLASYARMVAVKARHPGVTFLGPCFLREGVTIEVRPGYGRIIIGPWVHIGAGTALRCHEGTLRIGAKAVLGRRCTINTWLDVEIGEASIVADDVYLCDFDHITDRLDIPIKDQGIVKSPVRIGADVWLGTKTTVTRGTRVGEGCVVGAASVLRGDYPAHSVIVGAPARVVRSRDPEVEKVRLAAGVADERMRVAARAVITDGRGRVLLLHFELGDPAYPDGVWACPGAPVGPDEDAGAVLQTEVESIAGGLLDGVGDPVWVREVMHPDETSDGLREYYYLLDVDGIPEHVVEVDPAHLLVEDYVDRLRWWTLEEIAETQRRSETGEAPVDGQEHGRVEQVLFSPLALVHLLGDLFAHGRPPTPRRVDAPGERPLPQGVRRH